jgi:hypothetical protein
MATITNATISAYARAGDAVTIVDGGTTVGRYASIRSTVDAPLQIGVSTGNVSIGAYASVCSNVPDGINIPYKSSYGCY